MGTQIGFYAIEKDHATLLELADRVGFVALPELIPNESKPRATRPTLFELPGEHGRFYLLPDDLALVEAFYGQTHYDPSQAALLSQTSPVIEFSLSTRKGDEVYPGRLYLGLARDATLYPIVRKKFDSLVREVRKWAKTGQFNFYVGPYTAELSQAGRVRLMWGSHILMPVVNQRRNHD